MEGRQNRFAPFDKTQLHGREKVKIGAVFVKCVVFNTSCVANFPSVTPAGEERIKERYRSKWTKVINEDEIIGMVKLVIT